MPFTASQRETRIIGFLRQFRARAVAVYSLSVGAVGLALLTHLAFGELIIPDAAFITFYPAIIVATLFGGLGPGGLSVALSAVAAWYFFPLPAHSWALTAAAGTSLLVFVIVATIIVWLIALLYDALEHILAREQEQWALIEAAPNGVIVVDHQGKIRLLNASAAQLFGYPRAELLGESVEVLLPKRMASTHKWLREAYLKAPETRAMGAGRDLQGRRKDGSEFPVEIGLNAFRRGGYPVVVASVVDISERHKTAEQERLLKNEMRHRTQNLLSVISGIVDRSFIADQAPLEIKKIILGRIQSLARAHVTLADAAWEGASLDRIIRRELEAFTDRAEVRGCDFFVGASAAQDFGLIVHELATNASKHGSLSVHEGHVLVEGRIEWSGPEGLFIFRWHESGGPPPAVPARRGQGSALLMDMARTFAEDVQLDYHSEGLRYELSVRLDLLKPVSKDPTNALPHSNPQKAVCM